MVAIATKETMGTHGLIPLVISVTESCGFGVVRVMFGIPKESNVAVFSGLVRMFSLFLDADVSDI